jgi:hypothetical protein
MVYIVGETLLTYTDKNFCKYRDIQNQEKAWRLTKGTTRPALSSKRVSEDGQLFISKAECKTATSVTGVSTAWRRVGRNETLTATHFTPDGGRKHCLQNVCRHLPEYKALWTNEEHYYGGYTRFWSDKEEWNVSSLRDNRDSINIKIYIVYNCY